MVDKGAVHRNRYCSLGGWHVSPSEALAVGRAAGELRELAALVQLAVSYADDTVEGSLLSNALAGCSRAADRIGDELERIVA